MEILCKTRQHTAIKQRERERGRKRGKREGRKREGERERVPTTVAQNPAINADLHSTQNKKHACRREGEREEKGSKREMTRDCIGQKTST